MAALEKLQRRSVGLEVIKMDNFTALIWHQRKLCDPGSCGIGGRCAHADMCGGDVCVPQKVYLENIYGSALDMLGMSLSTRDAVRLGVHLVPLYALLFDLKLAASGLSEVWEYYGKSGDRKINPIYREIREHIKVIDTMWSSLGYKQLVGHGSSADGDASYCDNMFSES